MCQVDEAPAMIAEEAWKQLWLVRYRIPAAETMDMYVDAGEGHDDFLMSIALLTEALASFVAPPESGYVSRGRCMRRRAVLTSHSLYESYAPLRRRQKLVCEKKMWSASTQMHVPQLSKRPEPF